MTSDARDAAAAATRQIIRSLVATDASDAEMALIAAELERVAHQLAPYDVSTRHDDPSALAEMPYATVAAPHETLQNQEMLRTHPVAGPWHPSAPPLIVDPDPLHPSATVTYSVAYEGQPGTVHGGVVAFAFDFICVYAAYLAGFRGVTGKLTVRYRKPVLLGTPVRYEAAVVEQRGRRTMVRGTLHGPAGLLAEADVLILRPPRRVESTEEPA